MKHLLFFLLIVSLIVFAFFALLCLEVAYDDSPAFAIHYCDTHTLLNVKLTLPYAVSEVGVQLSHTVDALPDILTAPPSFALRHIGELFAGIREVYLHETEGCTAFR